MCYTEQTWVPTLLIGLETFLGGMETAVERQLALGVSTLKPSLVEWKRGVRLGRVTSTTPLETFLGGMETALASYSLIISTHLETFLGGMETVRFEGPITGRHTALKPCLVEWKPLKRPTTPDAGNSLETFLGGMETRCAPGHPEPAPSLETFLGGMETVECDLLLVLAQPLETFLGGMETPEDAFLPLRA